MCAQDLDVKVVLKQTVLRGSNHPDMLQRIATVYMNGEEFKVYAPPGAVGAALEWVQHWCVHKPSRGEFGSELVVNDQFGTLAKRHVKDALERQLRDANRTVGMNPDGVHCDAQVCVNGHVLHCDGTPFDSNNFCTKCGAHCIDECRHCNEPIRGVERYAQTSTFRLPLFCHKCGRPYPWMEERLTTARELLRHDDELTPS